MAIPTSIALMIYNFSYWNGIYADFTFIGLNNYIEAFTLDPDFKDSVVSTVGYAVVMVVLSNLLALVIARFINSLKKTKKIFKTVLFLPNMIRLIVGAYMLKFIFTQVFPDIGSKIGFLSFLKQPWSSDPLCAALSIVAE